MIMFETFDFLICVLYGRDLRPLSSPLRFSFGNLGILMGSVLLLPVSNRLCSLVSVLFSLDHRIDNTLERSHPLRLENEASRQIRCCCHLRPA